MKNERRFYNTYQSSDMVSVANLCTKLMNSIILTILPTNFLKSDHINCEIQAVIIYIPYDKKMGITF